ncbi:MAG: PIN domain protein [Nitrospirae bacterium]|nr:PIN domain protein [Nitrospirota bacterium]
MRKAVIYVDTSVIGGCCDREFQEWSLGLLSNFKAGIFTLLLSELIDAEIQDAPNEVKDIYTEFRQCTEGICMVNTEAIELADAYLSHNILSQNYHNDALHIAVATIAEADLLVSWNFKHIVHFKKIQRFNAINLEMGYKQLLIYSPREVTLYGSEGS